jgi:hypothetical protein
MSSGVVYAPSEHDRAAYGLYVDHQLRSRSWTTNCACALVPVVASVEQNVGIYVEPNVWVEHPVVASKP